MKGFILAAGLGERLYPITSFVPKPLVPVMNIPVIFHTISLLRKAGIVDIAINLFHLGERIVEILGDGSMLGVNIHYSKEATIMGTGGGIKKMDRFLRGDAPFIVINSDIITAIDLKDVIMSHNNNISAKVTMVLVENLKEKEYMFSPSLKKEINPVYINKEGRIIRLINTCIDKKADTSTLKRYIFTGIQIIEPKILDHIPSDTYYNTTDNLYTDILLKDIYLNGYISNKYWRDIGTFKDYIEVHREILSGKTPRLIPFFKTKRDYINSTLNRIYIGSNCKIEPSAKIYPYTVIGNNCHIKSNTHIMQSIIWDNTIISEDLKIIDSIITGGTTVVEDIKNGILIKDKVYTLQKI